MTCIGRLNPIIVNLPRRQDYDGDGSADCVGVHVAGIGIIRSKSSYSNILDSGHMSPHKYLNTFSHYQLDGYCLAILFSNKVFDGKVLGLSWRGNNETRAGICQTRTNVASEGQDPEMLNLNSLFITMRTKHIKRIPLQMGVLNLAHEVPICKVLDTVLISFNSGSSQFWSRP